MENHNRQFIPTSALPELRWTPTFRAVPDAYKILRVGFTVAPIVAGLDKFSIYCELGHTYPVRHRLSGGLVTN